MNEQLINVKNIIYQGDLGNSISQLIKLTQKYSSHFHEDVVLQSAKFEQVKADERQGIHSSREIKRKKKRIEFALLELIDVIDEEEVIDENNSTNNTYKNLTNVIEMIHLRHY